MPTYHRKVWFTYKHHRKIICWNQNLPPTLHLLVNSLSKHTHLCIISRLHLDSMDRIHLQPRSLHETQMTTTLQRGYCMKAETLYITVYDMQRYCYTSCNWITCTTVSAGNKVKTVGGRKQLNVGEKHIQNRFSRCYLENKYVCGIGDTNNDVETLLVKYNITPNLTQYQEIQHNTKFN